MKFCDISNIYDAQMYVLSTGKDITGNKGLGNVLSHLTSKQIVNWICVNWEWISELCLITSVFDDGAAPYLDILGYKWAFTNYPELVSIVLSCDRTRDLLHQFNANQVIKRS